MAATAHSEKVEVMHSNWDLNIVVAHELEALTLGSGELLPYSLTMIEMLFLAQQRLTR